MREVRNQWDIMADILRVAVMGETKTHIMYKCSLSVNQLRNYLVLLLNRGFLDKEDGSTFYVTTSKGHTFIKTYDKLLELNGTSYEAQERNSKNEDYGIIEIADGKIDSRKKTNF
jgi:predicted transcriptional regulator